jgi:hypothetical protein
MSGTGGAAHGPEGRTSGGGSRRGRAGATARARARGSDETRRGVPTPTRNPRRGRPKRDARARRRPAGGARGTRPGKGTYVGGRARPKLAHARVPPNRARATGIFKRDETDAERARRETAAKKIIGCGPNTGQWDSSLRRASSAPENVASSHSSHNVFTDPRPSSPHLSRLVPPHHRDTARRSRRRRSRRRRSRRFRFRFP